MTSFSRFESVVLLDLVNLETCLLWISGLEMVAVRVMTRGSLAFAGYGMNKGKNELTSFYSNSFLPILNMNELQSNALSICSNPIQSPHFSPQCLLQFSSLIPSMPLFAPLMALTKSTGSTAD